MEASKSLSVKELALHLADSNMPPLNRNCLKRCLISPSEAVRQMAEEVRKELESREDSMGFRA